MNRTITGTVDLHGNNTGPRPYLGLRSQGGHLRTVKPPSNHLCMQRVKLQRLGDTSQPPNQRLRHSNTSQLWCTWSRLGASDTNLPGTRAINKGI